MPQTYISAFGTGETHHAGLPASTLRAGGAGAAVLAGSALRGGGRQCGGHGTPPLPETPAPWSITYGRADFALRSSIAWAAGETLRTPQRESLVTPNAS